MRVSIIKWTALGSALGLFFGLYQVFGRNLYHGQEAAIDLVASAAEFGLIGAAIAVARNWAVKRRAAKNLPPVPRS